MRSIERRDDRQTIPPWAIKLIADAQIPDRRYAKPKTLSDAITHIVRDFVRQAVTRIIIDDPELWPRN